MEVFGTLFASFWRLFTSLRVPILGISFVSLYLGVFVVTLSIRVLRPLLNIGARSAKSGIRALHSSHGGDHDND